MTSRTPRPARALSAAAALLLLASCGAPAGEEPAGEGAGPAAGVTATAAESPAGPGPATEGPTTGPAESPAASGSPADPGTEAPAAGPTASATPVETPTAGSPTDGPAAPAEPVTYAGTAADAAFAFELPATWTVDGQFSDVGGTVTVLGPDGTPVGQLSVLVAWGAECGPDCTQPAVAHLGDVPGTVPLSSSGPFVVRSVAMDLTGSPRLREINGWQDNVRLTTSLTDADVPPPTAMLPHVLYGLGLVETGVVAPNGITYRTVIFSSVHDFPTVAAAEAYAATEEHRQVQAMIASFRA